ncbi:MAG TPA: DUF5606 domain-containing protein [Flavipsychrobacter sp.]|jgi:hypothetical protein|nr:DUF5606 domain-containing protein [Flavipsychrobacter sp.]
MEYREIVSVTGLGGLFQLLSTKSDGAIVKNLADQSTKFISARLHNVTPLESIEIYTIADNVRLHEVLQLMKDSNESKPNVKTGSNEEIKGYFKKVFPNLDDERVYVSDMKKMLKWFDILKANDLLNFEMYNQPAEEETAAVTEEVPSEKAEKKTSAKKATKKENSEASTEVKEKPAKKSATKKVAKAETGEEAKEKPAKKSAKKSAE